jgi:predicted DNA-binding transcriptional regulator AlpA
MRTYWHQALDDLPDGVRTALPSPIKLGVRAVGWLENEVREWIAMRIEMSRPSPAGKL